jgi:transposase InsO family protein
MSNIIGINENNQSFDFDEENINNSNRSIRNTNTNTNSSAINNNNGNSNSDEIRAMITQVVSEQMSASMAQMMSMFTQMMSSKLEPSAETKPLSATGIKVKTEKITDNDNNTVQSKPNQEEKYNDIPTQNIKIENKLKLKSVDDDINESVDNYNDSDYIEIFESISIIPLGTKKTIATENMVKLQRHPTPSQFKYWRKQTLQFFTTNDIRAYISESFTDLCKATELNHITTLREASKIKDSNNAIIIEEDDAIKHYNEQNPNFQKRVQVHVFNQSRIIKTAIIAAINPHSGTIYSILKEYKFENPNWKLDLEPLLKHQTIISSNSSFISSEEDMVSAKDFWMLLNYLFNKSPTNYYLNLQNQLKDIRYEFGQHPITFYEKINKIADELAEGGPTWELPLTVITGTMISAIPDSLIIVKQNLTALEPSKLTPKVVYDQLLRFYEITNKQESAYKIKHANAGNTAYALNEESKKHQNGRGGKKHFKNRGRNQKENPNPSNKIIVEIDKNEQVVKSTDYDFLFSEVCCDELTDGHYSQISKSLTTSISDNGVIYIGSPNHFIFDTGSQRNTVCIRELLFNVKPMRVVTMYGITNHPVKLRECGTVRVSHNVLLNNAVYVPKSTVNLVSVSALEKGGAKIVHIPGRFEVYKNKELLLTFKLMGGHYVYIKESSYDLDPTLNKEKPSIEKAEYKGKIPKKSQSNKPNSKNDSDTAKARKELEKSRAATAKSSTQAVTTAVVPATSNAPTGFCRFVEEDETSFSYLSTESLNHQRYGHRQKLYPEVNCVPCITGKAKRTKIGKKTDKEKEATEVFQRLHGDIDGPITGIIDGVKEIIETPTGYRYYLSLIDEKSRYSFVYLLGRKSEAASRIKELITFIHTQYGKYINELHTDNGGEFVNLDLKEFLTERGIIHTTTTPYTPKHNPIVERSHGVDLSMTRTAMIKAGVPLYLWGECILYMNYIKVRLPLEKLNGFTPYECVTGKLPSMKKIKVFGCDSHVLKYEHQQAKIGSRTWLGIFVGVDSTANGYRIYNPETGKVVVTRNVHFTENSFTACEQLAKEEKHYTHDLHVDEEEYAPESEDQTNELVRIKEVVLMRTQPEADEPQIVEIDDETVDENSSSNNANGTDNDLNKQQPNTSAQSSTDSSSTDGPIPKASLPSPKQVNNTTESSMEDKMPIKLPPHSSDNLPIPPLPYLSPAKPQQQQQSEPEPEVRRSTRIKSGPPPDYTGEKIIVYNRTQSSTALETIRSLLAIDGSDLNYHTATKGSDRLKWMKAMDEEIESITEQKVFMEVECPRDVKPIRTRWHYRIKLDKNNNPIKFKARLVVRGDLQKEGINYDGDDIFAPVARSKSIKILLSYVAQHDYELKQMDYKCAFLNAELKDEEIYVTQPPGYEKGSKTMVWKLLKALYGLKQAPVRWNKTIDGKLRSLGYHPTTGDPCIYVKRTPNGIIILFLYVDDTVSGYSKADESIWLSDKAKLEEVFKIEDLGDCNFILNMVVTRNRQAGTIALSQQPYIERLVEKYGVMSEKSAVNPVIHDNIQFPILEPDEKSGQLLSTEGQAKYQSIVGALLYASNMTRLDITYAVNILARYTHTPYEAHLQAAMHVLRYLKGTPGLGLMFTKMKNPTEKDIITAYADASYANDTTRKSISGIIVKLYGNVVVWYSKRQSTTALSTTESEYMAISSALQEVLWMKQIILEMLNISTTVPLLLSDNTSAINIAKSDGEHQRTKHIDVRHHFIKDCLKKQDVVLNYVPTALQDADILTKRMNNKLFSDLLCRLMTVKF